MGKFNSKAKGGSHERATCKSLSLWISNGKHTDCFWRSSLSGGRSTVALKKGVDVRQSGDICAVTKEGHQLTDHFFIECKHYKKLDFDGFFIKGTGVLGKFWRIACKEAKKRSKKPLLIARQNNFPDLVLTYPGSLEAFQATPPDYSSRTRVSQPSMDLCEVVWLNHVLEIPFKASE